MSQIKKKEKTSLKPSATLLKFLDKYSFFKVNENNVSCDICKENFKIDCKTSVSRFKDHLDTSKHKINVDNKKNLHFRYKSFSLEERKDEFHLDFIEMMCRCNIPFNICDMDFFKDFFKKWVSVKLYSSTHYRSTILPKMANDKIDKIKKFFIDKFYYIQFDETSDSCGRKILNLLIGQCIEVRRKRPFLIKSVLLQDCTGENVCDQIEDLVLSFSLKPEDKNNFKLLLSDQAPYCVLAGKLLKRKFPDLKHITCLAHCTHLVSQSIMKANIFLNDYIVELKKSLNYNKKNIKIYKKHAKLAMIPFPIITRWGTWLFCAVFIKENYEQIDKYINILSDKYSKLKELSKSAKLKEELDNVLI